jgi:hypothetical protein
MSKMMNEFDWLILKSLLNFVSRQNFAGRPGAGRVGQISLLAPPRSQIQKPARENRVLSTREFPDQR